MGANEDRNPPDDPGTEVLKKLHWQCILSYGEEQARSLGLMEADVPRLIEEYRRERREGK